MAVCSCVVSGLLAFYLLRRRQTRRAFVFSHILVALLCAVTFFGAKWVISKSVPPWPFRDLRPQTWTDVEPGQRGAFTLAVWDSKQYNSWGMRDLERSFEKKAGTKRILFIGDSFLEGGFCEYPISLLIEKKLHDQGRKHIECVNLGVSGTGPVHYYYRLKDIGLACRPDTVYLFVYSGNDYLQPEEFYQGRKDSVFANFVAERPLPSITGKFFPEANWLIVNRFNLSERGPDPIPDELEFFKNVVKLPYQQGMEKVVDHMHRHYRKNIPKKKLHAILDRGGEKLWKTFQPKEKDCEYLQGWIINNLLEWELSDAPYYKTCDDVPDAQIKPHVASTASWVKATYDLCQRNNISMKVILAPVSVMDPALVEFWRPWPAAYSFAHICHARHLEMAKQLRALRIPTVDLIDTLVGIPNTYRLSDRHWTEKGHDIVADRLLREFISGGN